MKATTVDAQRNEMTRMIKKEITVGTVADDLVSTGMLRGYIILDGDDHHVTAYLGERSGMPISVYNGRDQQWALPYYARADRVREFLGRADVLEALGRILAHHTLEWDWSNMIGRLGEAGENAREEFDDLLLEEDDWLQYEVIIDPEDYLSDQSTSDAEWADRGGPVTALSTDEDLLRIAAAIQSEMESDWYIEGDWVSALGKLRETAREEDVL